MYFNSTVSLGNTVLAHYTLRNTLLFISYFRKHSASSGQKTHLPELRGRLSPDAVFTVRKWFCTLAVQMLYIFIAIKTHGEQKTAEDEASDPPGPDIKQWVSWSLPHLHGPQPTPIFTFTPTFPVETLSP